MRCHSTSLAKAELAVTILLFGDIPLGESFLFASRSFSRFQLRRSWHGPTSPLSQHQLVEVHNLMRRTSFNSNSRVSRPRRMATADASPRQEQREQQLSTVGAVDNSDGVEGIVVAGTDVEGVDIEATQQPRPKSPWMVRTGVASDGTALVFCPPSTQHMHQLQMSNCVARKEVSSLIVALRRVEEEEQGEPSSRSPKENAESTAEPAERPEPKATGEPLAGVVIEAMDGLGGSSAATRVCLLRHTRKDGVSEDVEHALLDEAITQFLNGGSRISQLRVEIDDGSKADFYARHGFVRFESNEKVAPGRVLLSGERDAALCAVRGLLEQEAGGAVVMNLLARLLHDAGDLQGAVDAYLKAVQMDPSRSEVFRGLGGAYQSLGQQQMAFASYQQAINLRPTDLLAYLKLGLLYEQLAVGKYEEAGDHAIRCFDYYLQHSGTEDTDVLTRLGNLQVLRLDPASAVKTYERALAVDPSLANIWFNLANAHLKLGHEQEATRCLREQGRLTSDAGVSTKYLLASLESDPGRLTEEDQVAYARELFDYYAPSYDDHMRKKLLYTAPRLLRQNVRDVYNATFQALPDATRSEYDFDVLAYLHQTLDILDLGCGTGLVGSWFKDYGRKIVGVDVSPTMLDMATKKGCYHELRKGDVRVYLSASDECQFDLVVAAETLQYLGPLGHVFATCYKVLKPGGLLAFTVDRQQGQAGEDEEKEEEKDVDDQGPPASGGQGDAGGTAEVSDVGCLLKTEGTYEYSRAYLVKLARLSGYEIMVLKRHAARVERGDPAPGYMGVYRRPTGGADTGSG